MGGTNDGPGLSSGETWQRRLRPEERQCAGYGPTALQTQPDGNLYMQKKKEEKEKKCNTFNI